MKLKDLPAMIIAAREPPEVFNYPTRFIGKTGSIEGDSGDDAVTSPHITGIILSLTSRIFKRISLRRGGYRS
jgi:hypothetical protein